MSHLYPFLDEKNIETIKNCLKKTGAKETKKKIKEKIKNYVIDFGKNNDKVFVKHIGITASPGNLEEYYSKWVESKNTVHILKPILSEAFRITVLVAKKGKLDSYSLCII